jgi:hypothetical protein
VPQIREVAIADSFALIGGYPAWFLGRVLGDYPGGLERLLARSGIPSKRREDVLRAVGALIHGGGRANGDADNDDRTRAGCVRRHVVGTAL